MLGATPTRVSLSNVETYTIEKAIRRIARNGTIGTAANCRTHRYRARQFHQLSSNTESSILIADVAAVFCVMLNAGASTASTAPALPDHTARLGR